VLLRGSAVFAFAKLLEEGVAQEYLAEACPRAGFTLCSAAAHPTDANRFLWHEDSLLYRFGGPGALADEAGFIVRNTLLAFPARILKARIAAAFEQFFSVSVGTGLSPGSVAIVLDNVNLGAGFEEAARVSRQSRNVLPIGQANWLAFAGLAVAFAAVVALLIIGTRRRVSRS